MSTPQTEDGYTRIANELLDAVINFDFSKRQYAVIFAVIRKTYGFNKKSDALSAWQIADMTGIGRSHVSEAITELCAMNVLIKSENGRLAHGQIVPELSINKQYKKWSFCPKTGQVKTSPKTGLAPVPKQDRSENGTCPETGQPPVPKQDNHLSQNGTPPVPKQDTHKDNSKRQLPKDNYQKTVCGELIATAVAVAPKKTVLSDEFKQVCRETWEAYASGYFQRYGIEPVRNAKVSKQVINFCKRIPQADAPHVARHFTQSNAGFYVTKGHQFGNLLADAEKMRTEWATGNSMTQATARQIDATQSNFNAVEQAIALANRRATA